MHNMRSELGDLRFTVQSQDAEISRLVQLCQEQDRRYALLAQENRELRVKHDEETSVYRKQIQYFKDQISADPAPAMSAVPSSTGYTDFNDDMGALSMDGWDSLLIDDFTNATDDFPFGMKSDSAMPSPAVTRQAAPTTMPQPNTTTDESSEQPIASGLLFFLLLCGAFVVSKPQSRVTELHGIPDQVHAAAPTVLNDLLYGDMASLPSSRPVQRPALEPRSSSSAQTTTRTSSKLDHIHRRITSPTKQQEIEEVFSLTTAQYASITNGDLPPHEEPSYLGPHGLQNQRPNLAQVLSRRQDHPAQNSKSDVYTRSLLWDQIPEHVVRQFKEMVRDHNELEGRERRQMNHDDDEMLAYKVET
jgi:hypothetical protein